MPEAAEPELDS